MTPEFFIIGAPKCGTTALAAYLAEHPEVLVSDPKELNYFNTDLGFDTYDDAAYAALFAGAAPGVIRGEASVWYLYSEVAVARILEARPDARFIVMLRNPVDMVVSLHRQMVFSGYDDVDDFWSAWELQAERAAGRHVPIACPDARLLSYQAACALGTQLARCLAQTADGQVLVVVYDDFRTDPRGEWQRVQQFLGVSDDGRHDFPVINPATVRRWMPLKRLSDWYSRTRRRFGFAGLGTGVFNRLNEVNQVEEPAPPLPPEQRATLAEAFAGEVEQLSSILERDLSHWR